MTRANPSVRTSPRHFAGLRAGLAPALAALLALAGCDLGADGNPGQRVHRFGAAESTAADSAQAPDLFRGAGVAVAADEVLVRFESTGDELAGAETADLLYSDDRLGNQNWLPIAEGLDARGGTVQARWDVTAVPEGVYTVRVQPHAHGAGREAGRAAAHSAASEFDASALTSAMSVSVVRGLPDSPTYYGDAQAILRDNCFSCHQPGGGGQPEFHSLETVRAHAQAIKLATRHNGRARNVGYMPPFFAADDGSRFANYKGLSESEILRLATWVDDGAPAGDASKSLPDLAATAAGPEGHTDFTPPETFTPATARGVGEDVYQCFLFDPGFTEPTYIVGNQVLPDNAAMVHHVIVYALTGDATALREHDAANGEPGYRCFGTGAAGFPLASAPVVLWAPGKAAEYHADQGILVEPGTLLAMQVHYSLSVDPDGVDRSAFRLWTTTEKPAIVQRLQLVLDFSLNIPAGAEGWLEENTVNFNTTATVHAFFPHMHTRGREISLGIQRAGTDSEAELIRLPTWNFDWQDGYIPHEPVPLARGDKLTIRCTYDNDTDEALRWGENTSDEMCLVYLLQSSP